MGAEFLDILRKLDYLVALGVNAVQLLPVVEFSNPRSEGYEGADIFSPEMDYAASDPAELGEYLLLVNGLLGRKGLGPLAITDLGRQSEQLKALVDVFHVHGMA